MMTTVLTLLGLLFLFGWTFTIVYAVHADLRERRKRRNEPLTGSTLPRTSRA